MVKTEYLPPTSYPISNVSSFSVGVKRPKQEADNLEERVEIYHHIYYVPSEPYTSL